MGEALTRSVAMQSAVYVSYDGALDPLGSSQVVPYVVGLASDVRMTLVSFEKQSRWDDAGRREAMRSRLSSAGVDWHPLRYHLRPRLPATAWDILRGAVAVARAVRTCAATIVHCRGEVAMLMARRAVLPRGTRLLLDKRGFFADERVESGSWRAGSAVDRTVRSVERANLRRADGLVVLTRAALEVLRSDATALPKTRVIPTCADGNIFRPRPAAEEPAFSAVYAGSLGTWYMVDEMVALARAIALVIPGKALFLTPDTDIALRAGVTPDWGEVRSADPLDVATWLRRALASFFVIRPTPAKRASCPTKLAEALACGLPVIANRGIGDVDGILEAERVGVSIDELTPAGYARAAERLAILVADPETATRCRSLAERRFSLASGVAAYRQLYAELSIGTVGPRPGS